MSSRNGSRIAAATVTLALAAVACAGVGRPSLDAPDVPDFDPSALIDVLPPDRIPAIRQPAFGSADDAAAWLGEEDPVLAVSVGLDARAYPLAILTRHEIVNDTIGGRPAVVTYCPLCNSAVVYGREVRGRTLTFVVSGKLYHSDLVMLDEETRSLWPQLQGAAVLGDLRGARLEQIPASLVPFAAFRSSFPDGRVLSRPGDAPYRTNPYQGYDSRDGPYGDFFTGEVDPRLPAMERVVGLAIGDEARAYAFSRLGEPGAPAVVHDLVGGSRIVIFWSGVQRSALDSTVIADGRRVGVTGVFIPEIEGRLLRFHVDGDVVRDVETGTAWSVLGLGRDGPLAGKRLTAAPHVDAFWFAWSSFVPSTTVWDR